MPQSPATHFRGELVCIESSEVGIEGEARRRVRRRNRPARPRRSPRRLKTQARPLHAGSRAGRAFKLTARLAAAALSWLPRTSHDKPRCEISSGVLDRTRRQALKVLLETQKRRFEIAVRGGRKNESYGGAYE